MNNNSHTDIEFEMLKYVFFVVTYLLITNGMDFTGTGYSPWRLSIDGSAGMNMISNKNFSPFYSTLFIFSATTWIDSLSEVKYFNRRKYSRYYYGYSVSAEKNPYIGLIGSIVGIFIVIASMYIVCVGDNGYLGWALWIYRISAIFMFLKGYSLVELIFKDYKNLF